MSQSQPWPDHLEPYRSDALATITTARASLACALQDRDHGSRAEAAAWSSAACRDCLRLVAAAADHRPPSGRWSSRFVALRELINNHATEGLVLAQQAKCANGDSRPALVELVQVLADVHFYLEQLGRRHAGVSI